MRITKKAVSIVLAIMMVAALIPIAAVSVSAEGETVDVSTYAQLKAALAEGKNAHVTAIFPINTTETLDLAGKTVTVDSGKYIVVNTNANPLTIVDSIGGGKITSTSFPVGILNRGKLVLESGTIESTGSVALLCQSNSVSSGYTSPAFTMTGGKLLAPQAQAIQVTPNSSAYAEFKIEGGEIEGYYAIGSVPTASNYSAKINISGGTFTTTSSDIFYEKYTGALDIKATGGAFNHDTTGIIGSADASLGEDDYYHLTYNPYNIYNTETFRNAVMTGGEYNVTKDFNYTYSVYTNLKADTIIHGNNHTISGTTTSTSRPNMIEVNAPDNESSLTIDGLTIDANQKYATFYKNNASKADNENQVISLTDCTFEDFNTKGYGVVTGYGYETIIIDGCTFKNNTTSEEDGFTDLFLPTGANVTIKDSVLEGSVQAHIEGSNRDDNYTFEITGSTIGSLYLEENADPVSAGACSYRITKLENSVINEIVVENPGTTAEDLDVILDRDPVTHVNTTSLFDVVDTNDNPVAPNYTIGSEEQLNNAINAGMVFGAVYTLSNNVELSSAAVIPAGTTLSFDLNGYDIYGDINAKMIQNNGTLTINDTSANPGHVYNTNVSKQGNDAVVNYGTLTIKNGYFGDSDSDQTNANAYNRGGAVRNLGGTLTIDGGYFTACDNFTNGGYAYAIINDDDGAVVINDATVYGNNNGNVANNSGTAEINGGTFTLNGEKSYYTFYADDGKVTINNATVNHSTPKVALYTDVDGDGDAPVIDVNGGNFTINENYALGNDTENVTVYGGTFSKNVYEFISTETPEEFNIRNTDGTNTASNNPEVLSALIGVDSTAYDDWSGLGNLPLHNLEILGFQKKTNTTKADGNEYATHGVRFVAVVNEGLLKSANIDDYGFVLAKASGLNQNEIGDKFNNMKYNGGNGERTESCKGSSNTLSGDYGKYSKSTTYKYVTAAVNGMSAGEQVVARFYIKTTTGHIYYANYYGTVTSSGLVATMS